MILPHDLVTIARALRIMAGYDSREMRIGALKNSKFIDVKALAMRLEDAGHLSENSINDMPTVEDYHS